MSKFSQKGVSLYFGIVIMSLLLGMVLGMSTILYGQIKTTREIWYSVIAFYAADTGIEEELKRVYKDGLSPLDGYFETLDNGADYEITVLSGGVGDCLATNYCIKSVGTYKNTKRAIEIQY